MNSAPTPDRMTSEGEVPRATSHCHVPCHVPLTSSMNNAPTPDRMTSEGEVQRAVTMKQLGGRGREGKGRGERRAYVFCVACVAGAGVGF